MKLPVSSLDCEGVFDRFVNSISTWSWCSSDSSLIYGVSGTDRSRSGSDDEGEAGRLELEVNELASWFGVDSVSAKTEVMRNHLLSHRWIDGI